MKILISTASFPYHPGEQFLESEIDHWASRKGIDVVVVPATAAGQARPVPDNVDVWTTAAPGLLGNVAYAARACLSPLFWKELGYLLAKKQATPATLSIALKSVALTLRAKHRFGRLLSREPSVSLAYAYWNAEAAYGLCLLKREGLVKRVISRAHGHDLYQERRREGYMPLKRQFVRDFDLVHAISEDALAYLHRVYGFANNNLNLSRLGVVIPKSRALGSSDGVLRLISVSFCVPIKRLHKIIESIKYACKVDSRLVIEWTHIGEGPLKRDLEAYAAACLGPLANASYRFAGHWSNSAVLSHLARGPIDVLINTSSSEGVPVSIMEAMACGIPAVAPDVGGVSELVNDRTGALLSQEMTCGEVYEALLRLSGENAGAYRREARLLVKELYSADVNYGHFVAKAVELTESVQATHH